MLIQECTHTPHQLPVIRPRKEPESVPEDQFVRKPAAPTPSGPLTEGALQEELANQDLQQAREIWARIRAARRLTDAKIAAILEDLSTTLFALFSEVALKRRKVCDDLLEKWNKVMFE